MSSVKCPVHEERLLCTVNEQTHQIEVGCSLCGRWLSSLYQPHSTVAEIEWYVRVLITSWVESVTPSALRAVTASGKDLFVRC